MTGTLNQEEPGDGPNTVPQQAAAALRFTVSLPFKIAARLARHTVQILFALFVLILHPQLKWLFRLIAGSALVQNYVKPSLRIFAVHVYEPYFYYLSRLPPFWATFSIALPLAVLEPTKLYATILVAERPKTGVILWLALQGLSLVLIDRTWTAVRPQSRKILARRPRARLGLAQRRVRQILDQELFVLPDGGTLEGSGAPCHPRNLVSRAAAAASQKLLRDPLSLLSGIGLHGGRSWAGLESFFRDPEAATLVAGDHPGRGELWGNYKLVPQS